MLLFCNGVHTYVHKVVPSACFATFSELHSLYSNPLWLVDMQSFRINTSMIPCRQCRLAPTISVIYDPHISLCPTRRRQFSDPESGNKMNWLSAAKPSTSPLVLRLGSESKLNWHPLQKFLSSWDTAISRMDISTTYKYDINIEIRTEKESSQSIDFWLSYVAFPISQSIKLCIFCYISDLKGSRWNHLKRLIYLKVSLCLLWR